MDGKTTSSESWTDEKHLRYLNSIEASFVRTMLENNDLLPLHLRLDRYLPDASDSTLDSKPHHRTRLIKNSDRTGSRGRLLESKAYEKRSRRFIRSSQPLNSSQDDQVVPQMEIRTVGDKDKKDQLNVPSAPVNTRS